MTSRILFIALAAASLATGCGSSDASTSSGAPGGGNPELAGTDQTPPTTGGADVDAWLSEARYKAWHCEPMDHAARAPSPHGANRICSNDALSAAGPSGPFPAGSAGVKELYSAVGGTIIGYAVYFKTAADSAGGKSWYWYEKSSGSVVADGYGVPLCTGCHSGAGPDHSPTSRDFVWTQVE